MLAQPHCTVTRYDEDSGMAQWHVTQMVQDHDGIMWFSTWNGLDRFDGYAFTNFKSRPGDGAAMPTDRIRDLRLDAQGRLCCKTDDDWYLFDRLTGTFQKVPERQEQQLSQSKRGRFGIGTHNQPLDHTAPDGTQWHLSADGHLSYLSHDGRQVPYQLNEPLTGISFHMADEQGNLWLISNKGVYHLCFHNQPTESFPQERPAAIGTFFKMADGHYWVTTRVDGTVRLYAPANQLLGYLTADGRLSPTYTTFTAPVYCITQTRDGTIWMGSKPGGLFRLRAKATGQYRQGYQVDQFVMSNDCPLPCNDVYNIQEDRHGRLWIATMGGGICCAEPEKNGKRIKITGFIGKSNYPKMRENKVRFLHITHDDILLAATTEGLLIGRMAADAGQSVFRLHTKEAQRASSLSSNATMDILEDHRHHLFISTESGGVNELPSRADLLSNELSFIHHDQSTGLNSDVALALTLQGQNIMVVGSNQITLLNPVNGNTEYFDAQFFHQALRFSDAHPILLADGHWLFGLTDGAFTLDAARIGKSRFIPRIVLTAANIQNNSPLTCIDHLATLTLKPNERTLTLFFSTTDYTNPENIKYAFRMGDSQDWHFIGNTHTASFAGMEPGKYLLQIRSTNADGVWVDNVRTLEIVVQPHFWEAWYGKLLLVVLLLAAVATVVYTYLYIRRIKRQQHKTLEAYLALIESHEQPQPLAPAASVAQAENTPDSPPHQQPVADDAAPAPQERTTVTLTPDDEAFMNRVMAFVEQNIGNSDANMDDMASATATSRSGLSRKMKSLVGLTPADFLREARIKRAGQLLREGQDSVAEVAYRCGFSDPKYFSKCFKASTGQTPKEYKNAQMA